MDAAAIARAYGGIVSRAQLVGAGADGTDITRAVRMGALRRVRRAHYATPEAPAAGVEAVRIGGRLDGMSAGTSYGLWADIEHLEVVVPANASRLRAPREETTRIRWADSAPSRECWRLGLPATLREVARASAAESAVACLDTARTEFDLSTATLLAWVGADSLARPRVLASRPGSDSGWESIVRQRLTAMGLRVAQQVALPGARRGDLLVERRLLIEVDGFEFHGDREAFERDHQRDAVMAAIGIPHMRLTVRQVRDAWPLLETQILAALRSPRLPFSGERVTGVAHAGLDDESRHSCHTFS